MLAVLLVSRTPAIARPVPACTILRAFSSASSGCACPGFELEAARSARRRPRRPCRWPSGLLAGVGSTIGSPSTSFELLDHLLELVGDRLTFISVSYPSMLLLEAPCFSSSVMLHPAAEPLGVDDDALDAGRHLQRVVLHVLAGPAEDRVQQLLFGGQLALALRRDLADQDVARARRRCRCGRCRSRRGSPGPSARRWGCRG